MDRKYIIIAIAAVLICAAGAYILLAGTTAYTRIELAENGTTIEVPDNMVTKTNQTALGVLVLKSDSTVVVSFNGAKSGLGDLINFSKVKTSIFKNETTNVTLKDPSIAGYTLRGEYTAAYASNNTTQDNIIVVSKDKNIAAHIIESILWRAPPKAESGIQNQTVGLAKNITS